MPFKNKNKRGFITSVKNCLNGLTFVLNVSKIEFIMVLLVISLVIMAEVFNTAIEKTVDLCTKEYNEIAKIAKDVSAFAVLTVCIFALIIGIIIFVPKIIIILGG